MMKRIGCVVAAALMLAGCGESEPKKFTRLDTAPAGGAPAGAASTAMATPAPDAAPAGPMAGGMGIPAPPQAKLEEQGRDLSLAGVKFTLAEGWTKDKPASMMRAAQYRLPGPGGDAEMVFFYFGSGQGGDAKANIDRWVGQFSPETATTATQGMEVAHLEQDTLKLALVRTSGTYKVGAMGPMMPAQDPKPGYSLFGVVVEGGPEGSVFVKTTGPKATVDAQSKALEAFARSIRKAAK